MEGLCPRCLVRLDLPESGTYECERCRTRFEVAIGSPQWRAPGLAMPAIPSSVWRAAELPLPAGAEGAPAGEGAALPEHATCAAHPANIAGHLCERCGDFMCRLCITPIEGRLYCPRCFELLMKRGALHFTHQQFTLPGLTFGLGITSLLLSWTCVNFPFAIAGIVTGVKALKEHQERPDLPNRKLTNWGIGLNAASLLVTAGVLLLFLNQSR